MQSATTRSPPATDATVYIAAMVHITLSSLVITATLIGAASSLYLSVPKGRILSRQALRFDSILHPADEELSKRALEIMLNSRDMQDDDNNDISNGMWQ